MTLAMRAFTTWLTTYLPAPRDERGASVIEYALLVALIAVVCALAIRVLGTSVSTSYSNTASGFAAN